jgi:putative transposase
MRRRKGREKRSETAAGFIYVAFILDLLRRVIVGWLVHHSHRGVQYTSNRYTERLGEISVVGSIGRKGS